MAIENEKKEINKKDNRIKLPAGYNLALVNEDDDTFKVKISYELGRGGSCIVYKGTRRNPVSRKNDCSVIIKEFYPSGIEIERTENNLKLIIKDQKGFDDLLDNFNKGIEEASLFYEENSDHSTCRIMFCGWNDQTNAFYTVSDINKGRVLKDVPPDDLSLPVIALIMENICEAIQRLHTKQKLYLDCKPENFLYTGDPDSVNHNILLFDFNTAISMNELERHEYQLCSASEGWVPKEQKLENGDYSNYRMIGYHTDVYSVGAVFFWLLTQRELTEDDLTRIHEKSLDWKKESRYCSGSGTTVIQTIQDLLFEMLNPEPEDRKNIFKNRYSLKAVTKSFHMLYGLTCGNDPHFIPIHEMLVQVIDEIQNNSKKIQDKIQKSKNDISDELNETKDEIIKAIENIVNNIVNNKYDELIHQYSSDNSNSIQYDENTPPPGLVDIYEYNTDPPDKFVKRLQVYFNKSFIPIFLLLLIIGVTLYSILDLTNTSIVKILENLADPKSKTTLIILILVLVLLSVLPVITGLFIDRPLAYRKYMKDHPEVDVKRVHSKWKEKIVREYCKYFDPDPDQVKNYLFTNFIGAVSSICMVILIHRTEGIKEYITQSASSISFLFPIFIGAGILVALGLNLNLSTIPDAHRIPETYNLARPHAFCNTLYLSIELPIACLLCYVYFSYCIVSHDTFTLDKFYPVVILAFFGFLWTNTCPFWNNKIDAVSEKNFSAGVPILTIVSALFVFYNFKPTAEVFMSLFATIFCFLIWLYYLRIPERRKKNKLLMPSYFTFLAVAVILFIALEMII